MEKIDKVVYYKLTTLLLKVKFFTYIINILFYIYLNDSEAIGGLLFNIVLLILFYLLRDKYFNLIRVLVCINEFIVVLIGFFILSLVHKNLMPLSVYIIIIIEILSQIFIPTIIFNYKSEKKYIIPIFLFYILLFLFIDDYIYLTTGTKIITLIHNSLTSFQWKITILFPFLGFLATILVFIRQIHYNEMIVKKYNEDLQATLEELRTTQQHMIQTEKMASLGTLTSGVAHEINNPLNFIQSGVIGLEHYLKENNPEMDG